MTPTPPPPADWSAVRRLFEAAGALQGAAREALLADPAHDAAVVREVRSLLGYDDGPSLLDQPPPLPAAVVPDTREGQRLGAWRITGALGSGGMGEVWAAERADGRYAGEAAIKLLKRGMDSAAVLARFAHEQQALARLSHPHIAHLLDAGLSADGLPYFVMERVHGRPIDEACAGLPLEARLRLFLQLTDAVAHAHRNLLVHRDLKPGNVLVNAAGQVKLLDFGIAKALAPDDGAATTQHGPRPFTPQYASPEQVRGEPVSTATDLYSLGVLLYVLLTGERPYGRAATTPHDAARAVLEEEPTRPSSLARPAPGWEATRRRLEGDLDNIVLKALEKPVERRYASVDALAADVRAYLQGFPVSARPASAAYVLGKFVRRHRWAVLAAALGGLGLATGLAAALLTERFAAALGAAGLAAGLAMALLQARAAAQSRDAAARARDEARRQLGEVKRITADLVFRFGDAVNLMPGGAAAQEALLQQTVASLEPALQGAPDDGELQAIAASGLARLAEIQGNTVTAAPERAAEARATVERALALGERAWPRQRADWRFASWHLRARTVQAQVLRGEGRLDHAVAALRRAVEQGRDALPLQADATGRVFIATGIANQLITLAQLFDHANLPSLGRPADALQAYREAEATYRELLAQPALLAAIDRTGPAGSPAAEVYLTHQVGTVLGGRALVHRRREQWPEMRAEAEAAFELRQRNVAREPANVAWRDGLMVEAHTLALARLRCGDAAGALAAARVARDTAEALARDEGPRSKWAGVGPQLAPVYEEALALSRRGDAGP